ncbi:hypothetical protein EJB05_07153, partial [Eragrostis curvula]
MYEEESANTKDNNLLGKFVLTGVPPAPKGVATFDIDTNGVLNVSAKDTSHMTTGSTNNINISYKSGRLSKEEIERMVKRGKRKRTSCRPPSIDDTDGSIRYCHCETASTIINAWNLEQLNQTGEHDSSKCHRAQRSLSYPANKSLETSLASLSAIFHRQGRRISSFNAFNTVNTKDAQG